MNFPWAINSNDSDSLFDLSEPVDDEFFNVLNLSYVTPTKKEPEKETPLDTKLDLFQSILRAYPDEVKRIYKWAIERIPWESLSQYDGDVSSMTFTQKIAVRRNLYKRIKTAFEEFGEVEDMRCIHMHIAIIFNLFHLSSPATNPYTINEKHILGIYGPDYFLRSLVCLSDTFPRCNDYFIPDPVSIDAFFDSREFDVARKEFIIRCNEEPYHVDGEVVAIVSNATFFVERLRKMLCDGGVVGFHRRLLAQQNTK